MATFAELKTMLLGFGALEETGRIDPAAQGWCLNMAIRRLCRRYRSSFNLFTDAITFAAADVVFPPPAVPPPWITDAATVARDYGFFAADFGFTLPATVCAVRTLTHVTVGGVRHELTYEPSIAKFRSLYPPDTNGLGGSPTAGVSKHWTLFGRSILLGPPPAYDTLLMGMPAPRLATFIAEWWKTLPDLAADGDTNGFAQAVPELVVFEALADFAAVYLMEDARIPLWQAKRDELLNDWLQSETDLRTDAAPEDHVMVAPGE